MEVCNALLISDVHCFEKHPYVFERGWKLEVEREIHVDERDKSSTKMAQIIVRCDVTEPQGRRPVSKEARTYMPRDALPAWLASLLEGGGTGASRANKLWYSHSR